MFFEWDPDKDRANRQKHSGIEFALATRVFADPNLVLRKDRLVDGEQRWHAHGEEIIRIISAREADPRERRIYLEQAAF